MLLTQFELSIHDHELTEYDIVNTSISVAYVVRLQATKPASMSGPAQMGAGTAHEFD